MQFGRQLAHTEKSVRDKAWIDVENHLKANTYPELEHLKIWKGLYYTFWMSDEPLIQQSLADSLSSLIHSLPISTALLYMNAFWKTIEREWYGIDAIRLNKYYMLLRKVYQNTFTFLNTNDWSEESMKIIYHPVKNSLLYHTIEAFFQELLGQVTSKNITVSKDIGSRLLLPFMELIKTDIKLEKLFDLFDFIQESCGAIIDLDEITQALYLYPSKLHGKRKRELEEYLLKWGKVAGSKYQIEPTIVSMEVEMPVVVDKIKLARERKRKRELVKNVAVNTNKVSQDVYFEEEKEEEAVVPVFRDDNHDSEIGSDSAVMIESDGYQKPMSKKQKRKANKRGLEIGNDVVSKKSVREESNNVNSMDEDLSNVSKNQIEDKSKKESKPPILIQASTKKQDDLLSNNDRKTDKHVESINQISTSEPILVKSKKLSKKHGGQKALLKPVEVASSAESNNSDIQIKADLKPAIETTKIIASSKKVRKIISKGAVGLGNHIDVQTENIKNRKCKTIASKLNDSSKHKNVKSTLFNEPEIPSQSETLIRSKVVSARAFERETVVQEVISKKDESSTSIEARRVSWGPKFVKPFYKKSMICGYEAAQSTPVIKTIAKTVLKTFAPPLIREITAGSRKSARIYAADL